MLRIASLVSLAALTVSILGAGCSAAPADAVADSTGAALSSKADAFVGTWAADGSDDANVMYYAFTFNSDKTFSAQGGCPQTGSGPHCFEVTGEQGTWKVNTSGPQLGAPQGAPQLVLDDQFGQETTYFYTLRGHTLSLFTQLVGDKVSKFDKQDGQVAAPIDPSEGSDAGAGQGDDATASQGDDASTADAGSDASGCSVDTDCQGLLPRNCETCSDGTQACAAWSCVQGTCNITYCQ